MDAVVEAAKVFFRITTPGLSMALLVLVTAVPLKLPGMPQFMPMVGVIALYYWCVHSPRLLPYSLVFSIGLVQDVLCGTPLGATSLLYLLLRMVVVGNRKLVEGEAFHTVWLGFVALSAAFAFVQWIVISVYYLSVFTSWNPVIQWALTVAFYPLLHMLFDLFSRWVSDSRHAQ